MKNIFLRLLMIFIISGMIKTEAQTFTKITDPANPIVSTTMQSNYSGAAWIDYNNDGKLDLFVTRNFLFKNEGNGNFSIVQTSIGEDVTGLGNGISWGDYDNDGDLDCYLAGNPSVLYRNDGNDIFTPVASGDISMNNDIRGWAAAWGDINNDGHLDLIVAHPANFVGTPQPSHFFKNNGDETFEKINSFHFTAQLAPYTVATWYDYDLDGDIDLFIASGPAGSAAPDYLYKNNFIETGNEEFIRIINSAIGTDPQDGQTWNFIDYDNDGDLDAFITNYGGSSDHFYENQNGTYVSVQNPLTTMNQGTNLANAWGDLDNDGDLDVLVTSEAGNYYYRNDDGIFVSVSNALTGSGATRGAVFGDYDGDGDLDVFVSGNAAGKALYRNDTAENNWIIFNCKGTVSNRSAIGTKVRVKAAVNGNSIWQYREINAQNSFNSQSALHAHFGLGNASTVDSVIIEFPSGIREIMTSVSPNSYYEIVESIPQNYLSANFTSDVREGIVPVSVQFFDKSIADPNSPAAAWEWDFNNDGVIDAAIQNPVYNFTTPGVYTVKLTVSNGTQSEIKIKPGFINVKNVPGVPVLNAYNPTMPDTTIARNGRVNFSVTAEDTTGYTLSYKWYKNGSSVGSNDSAYNYVSASILPAPRTDTVMVAISNGFNSLERTWLVHVDPNVHVEEILSGIPANYKLDQNFPNPFNPATNIIYSLPEESYVQIKIYNYIGKELEILVNERKAAGNYKISFNAEKYPSGVYFYKITADKFNAVKKMILIK